MTRSVFKLELLGVVWAMSKCKFYLTGLQHLDLISDHRSLVPILNRYTLDIIENLRQQRRKEKFRGSSLQQYDSSKDLRIPDALSRSLVSRSLPEAEILGTQAGFSISSGVTVWAVHSLASP